MIRELLTALEAAKLTTTDLLTILLDQDLPEYASHQAAFFSARNAEKLTKLMSMIWNHVRLQRVKPHPFIDIAVETVCNTIHQEMDLAKPHLAMTLKDVTPDFTEKWDIATIMGPLASGVTPTWTAVLDAATETKLSRAKIRLPRLRDRQTVGTLHIDCHILLAEVNYQGRYMISAQVHYLRSLRSCKVQIGIGIMAWSTGASRALINVLH